MPYYKDIKYKLKLFSIAESKMVQYPPLSPLDFFNATTDNADGTIMIRNTHASKYIYNLRMKLKIKIKTEKKRGWCFAVDHMNSEATLR